MVLLTSWEPFSSLLRFVVETSFLLGNMVAAFSLVAGLVGFSLLGYVLGKDSTIPPVMSHSHSRQGRCEYPLTNPITSENITRLLMSNLNDVFSVPVLYYWEI